MRPNETVEQTKHLSAEAHMPLWCDCRLNMNTNIVYEGSDPSLIGPCLLESVHTSELKINCDAFSEPRAHHNIAALSSERFDL